MGLMDILNGMPNGPRGQTDPNAKGGMSPITMALLALLAYKAYQKSGIGTGAPAPAPAPAPGRIPDRDTMQANLPGGGIGGLDDLLKGGLGGLLGGLAGGAPQGRLPGGRAAAPSGGGLDDLLKGGLGSLGGLLAGGAAGGVLGSGLDGLLKQLQQNGLGEVADSWVSKGPNKDISTNDLARSIGLDDIDALASRTGLSRNDLLSGLQQQLPELVDQLTPDGRMPTEDEASRWV
jgi:uncharacterized protein YidB (DUF937 family)